ncbi:MAG: hypothetical protein ACLR7Z_22395 [Bilophila wadsworthia]
MNLAFLALLPAALLIDRLFGNCLPRASRLHDGRAGLPHRSPVPARFNNALMSSPALACLLVVLPCRSRGRLAWAAQLYADPGRHGSLGHHHLDLRRAPEP